MIATLGERLELIDAQGNGMEDVIWGGKFVLNHVRDGIGMVFDQPR